MNLRTTGLCVLAAAFFAILLRPSAAQQEPAEPMPVLGDDTCWRFHMGWKTPEWIDKSGKVRPLMEPARGDLKEADRRAIPVHRTPTPPDGWVAVDWDDHTWARAHAPLAVNPWPKGGLDASAYYLICGRARFVVDDPAKVRGLTLSLRFVGGAVVYLNGHEFARSHLPEGKLAFDTPAEAYPDEAYIGDDGFLLADAKKYQDRFLSRLRKIDIDLPADRLRKGVNVLAVEIHRAPVSVTFGEHGYEKSHWRGAVGVWSHCQLVSADVSAAAGSAVRPNLVRPEGMQVWTAGAIESLFTWHYGDPAVDPVVALPPVPRNGSVTGLAIVSSTAEITGVQAAASALAGPGGASVPVSAVRVRYMEPAVAARSFNNEFAYDGLLRAPPEKAAVVADLPKPRWGASFRLPHNQPRAGANQPIALTVDVPADARPGRYAGTLTVRADGLDPVEVPVRLEVALWTLPDVKDFETIHNLYQSHESTAKYYGVELWSDRHFELMGEALAQSAEVANRFCTVHLIQGAYHMGNAQSMVRWVARDGGGWDHDFSIFDRYLDLYARHVGEPKVLLLSVWQRYADQMKDGKPRAQITVSQLDRATGKLSSLDVPLYGTDQGRAFWKPVLDGVRERLEKRGWQDVAVLGTSSDDTPTPATVSMFKAIWPDGRWMSSAHPFRANVRAADKTTVPVAAVEHVWSAGHPYNPDYERYSRDWGGKYPMPWKKGPHNLEWGFPRYGVACIAHLYEKDRHATWRMGPESTLQGGLTGFGRVGIDFFPLEHGRGYQALSGSEGAHLGPSASTRHFLYPGPDGPVATLRFELFREGNQVREAMIFLQKALSEGNLDDATAGRVRDLLDERARNYLRTRADQVMGWLAFESSGWQQRDRALYALCAEVAGKQGK